MLKNDFAGLFTKAVDNDTNIVKQAEISAFIDEETAKEMIKAEASKVHYNDDGNIINIDKSGLLVSDDFSKLFTEAVNKDTDIVKQAQIGTFIDKDTAEAIVKAEADKIHYDENGDITNFAKGGLVLKSNFNSLFNEAVSNDKTLATKADISTFVDEDTMDAAIKAEASKIQYTEDGRIKNIDKTGLMLKNDFASMFAQAVNENGDIVKQAQISTFITSDDAYDIVSNAEIMADRINFKGQTIINNHFKVDLNGNLEIDGKITTTEGKIGQFDITQKGLYNDAVNGLAQIHIKDDREYTQKDFSIGVENSKKYLCEMSNRNDPCLNVVSEHNTALNCYSDTGWSLKSSKTLIEGMHQNVTIINDTYLNNTAATDTYLTVYQDIIGLGYTNDELRVYLPKAKDAQGKTYIIKNFTDHTAHIWSGEKTESRIVLGIKPQLVYNMSRGESIFLFCDGTYWFVFGK